MDPFLSRLIPGENDGKVSVERTKIDGMQDLLVVKFGHTFITSKRPVIEATIHFLRSGRFEGAVDADLCSEEE